MLKLRLGELRGSKPSVKELSETLDIRWNTLKDYENNTAKTWSPEHLEKLMKYFGLKDVSELIEYREDEQVNPGGFSQAELDIWRKVNEYYANNEVSKD
ncbi:helix-turn-helix domain-containing protein [Paenibacillus sp. 22594]|uniref:helix-turn-helix domain-containing protein n=1 Tax=Paenibacillus sp. 22594 TaxID=3453947 RepID=UPI003F826519